MGAGEGNEVELPRADVEAGKGKPQKDRQEHGEKPESPPESVVQPFINAADKEQEELGDSYPAVEEAIAKIRAAARGELDVPETTEASAGLVLPIYEEAMQESDYPGRARAMVDASEKWREDPESIGFDDLATILEEEEKDLLASKADHEKRGVYPIYAEWFHTELDRIKYFRSIAGLMKTGDPIKYDAVPGMNALHEYIHEKLVLMRQGEFGDLQTVVRLDEERRDLVQRVPSDPDLQTKIDKLDEKKTAFERLLEIGGGLIPVFEIFEKKTRDYPVDEEWDEDDEGEYEEDDEDYE